MAIRLMCFACWISQATRTHAHAQANADTRTHIYARARVRTHGSTSARTHTDKYVIITAIPRQQWFRERASTLRLHIHCLSCFLFRMGIRLRISCHLTIIVNNYFPFQYNEECIVEHGVSACNQFISYVRGRALLMTDLVNGLLFLTVSTRAFQSCLQL